MADVTTIRGMVHESVTYGLVITKMMVFSLRDFWQGAQQVHRNKFSSSLFQKRDEVLRVEPDGSTHP